MTKDYKVRCHLKHYVYRHIRIDTNQPFYIGVGTTGKFNLVSRAFSNKRNIVWGRIVAKTDYKVEIFFETDDYSEALAKEQEFIKLYGRMDTKCGSLCNLTDGGEGVLGLTCKQATREKFRQRQLGSKATTEMLKNMSNAQLKRYEISGPSKKSVKVFQYDINGVFKKEWTSPTFAGSELSFSHAKIFIALEKLNHYAQGSFWYREYQGEKLAHIPDFFRHCKIAQYSLNGDLIQIFESLKEASIAVSGNRTGMNNIPKVCKGLKESYMESKWRYHFD